MIPWAAILRHAPTILAAADALRARARTSGQQEGGGSTEVRLASLEQGSQQSAQLLQDVAQQIQALALAHEAAARRAKVALIVAAAACTLAVGAGMLALAR